MTHISSNGKYFLGQRRRKKKRKWLEKAEKVIPPIFFFQNNSVYYIKTNYNSSLVVPAYDAVTADGNVH